MLRLSTCSNRSFSEFVVRSWQCGVSIVRLKSDDKYNVALPRLISLLNIASDSPSHVQAQESIAVCSQDLMLLTCIISCTMGPICLLAGWCKSCLNQALDLVSLV